MKRFLVFAISSISSIALILSIQNAQTIYLPIDTNTGSSAQPEHEINIMFEDVLFLSADIYTNVDGSDYVVEFVTGFNGFGWHVLDAGYFRTFAAHETADGWIWIMVLDGSIMFGDSLTRPVYSTLSNAGDFTVNFADASENVWGFMQ